MMKCSVRFASQDELEALVALKAACAQDNYRGFFGFAPMNDQDTVSIKAFFEDVFQDKSAKVMLLEDETHALCGYAVVKNTDSEAEIAALDALRTVSHDNMDRLIAAVIEEMAAIHTKQVSIFLLNNNFRNRFAFEQIGFRKDGTSIKQIIEQEPFELIKYFYRMPQY